MTAASILCLALLISGLISAVTSTDLDKAGKCQPSVVYNEVTLKGGINAGTYKDVGGVNTMEECQKKCCEFPACDLAFMLAGSCYLVGCYDQKQCAMQPAKESKFHPMLSYVTRWNGEGVKHTVLLQEKGVQNICPKIEPKTHVTLKGGLQAGDFTDVGKVANLEQCYDICCQQEKCSLAFMLGQNCFSVVCKEGTDLCDTIPAQPSIFNPQIAYMVKRERAAAGLLTTKSSISKPAAPKPSLTTAKGSSGTCPSTKTLERMTLKGGVEAGAYKDHGKVADMEMCRKICCEMTECHLAFMLGMNCFSVKCAGVDACRAQKAKPSAYYPKISYIRNVQTNELIRTLPTNVTLLQRNKKPKTVQAKKPSPFQQATDHNTVNLQQTQAKQPIVQSSAGQANIASSMTPAVSPLLSTTNNTVAAVKPLPVEKSQTTAAAAASDKSTSTPPASDNTSLNAKDADLIHALDSQPVSTPLEKSAVAPIDDAAKNNNTAKNNAIEAKDNKVITPDGNANALESNVINNVPDTKNNAVAPATKNETECKPGALKRNVTLRGGRNAGEFIEVKGLGSMEECVARCCKDRDQKCNLAFMLGDSCYAVSCKNAALCRTIPAPPTKFNPFVQYVRGLEEEPATTTPAPTTTTTVSPASAQSEASGEEPEKQTVQPKKGKKSCVSQPVVKGRSIRGGKKAGKFRIFKNVTTMPACIDMCCEQKNKCDLAYMEAGKCYSILCAKKSACTAVDQRSGDVEPQFSYMDHFLEKVDEEEMEEEKTTDLDVSEESACINAEIAHNKTLKGGTQAGKFHPMGKKDMKSCISGCCDRPNCDVAYLLNGHCYAVECKDVKMCQTTGEPSLAGDNVQLAYMNKAEMGGDKQRDYMVVYIIVGSLLLAATLGGLVWVAFAFSRKQRIKKSHRRLLDEDDEEPDEVLHKRPSRTPRYRQPRY